MRIGGDPTSCPYAAKPPVIDGCPDEWPDAPTVVLTDREGAVKADFRAAVKWENKTCIYELAIPWSEITPSPVAAGRKIGLSLAVNDCAPDSARQVYEFGSGITEEKDPSLFRPILLEGR